jgi:hypothetical protein
VLDTIITMNTPTNSFTNQGIRGLSVYFAGMLAVVVALVGCSGSGEVPTSEQRGRSESPSGYTIGFFATVNEGTALEAVRVGVVALRDQGTVARSCAEDHLMLPPQGGICFVFESNEMLLEADVDVQNGTMSKLCWTIRAIVDGPRREVKIRQNDPWFLSNDCSQRLPTLPASSVVFSPIVTVDESLRQTRAATLAESQLDSELGRWVTKHHRTLCVINCADWPLSSDTNPGRPVHNEWGRAFDLYSNVCGRCRPNPTKSRFGEGASSLGAWEDNGQLSRLWFELFETRFDTCSHEELVADYPECKFITGDDSFDQESRPENSTSSTTTKSVRISAEMFETGMKTARSRFLVDDWYEPTEAMDVLLTRFRDNYSSLICHAKLEPSLGLTQASFGERMLVPYPTPADPKIAVAEKKFVRTQEAFVKTELPKIWNSCVE